MSGPVPARLHPTREVPLEFKADGSVEATTFQSPTNFTIGARIEVPPMRVIPVLFIPGVMGTNLRKKANPQTKVWEVPNKPFEGIGAATSGYATKARERQIAFVPEEAEVDPDGPISVHHGMPHLNERVLRERGWGTIHQDSYGELLKYLEYHLNHIFMNKKPHKDWATMLQQQNAQRWGAHKVEAFDRITEEELSRLVRARFPVYAVGYNWLQSNEQSAHYLMQRIGDILKQWTKPHRCDKVLIVTHSMGGLVARRCSQLIPDKILGIVHGVMPALGAAAAYKRMRAGFEGAAALVLGWNEAEATASIANAPGPLELLPQPAYNDGKPWLQLQTRDAGHGQVYATESLPLKDAYAEIYEKDAGKVWYGLVDSRYIDPAGLHRSADKVPWDKYCDNLRAARRFHNKLADHYHTQTRAFYGSDIKYATWGDARWFAACTLKIASSNLKDGLNPTSNGTGNITVNSSKITLSFNLGGPNAEGDSTVPADASGKAPSFSSNVQQCFRLAGFDHQFAFNNPQARLVVLHSLAKQALRSRLLENSPYKTTATARSN